MSDINNKSYKISDINKITDTTKVRVWVDIINKLLDDSSDKEYIFKAISKSGTDTYNFENAKNLPSDFYFEPDANYIVTYGGIVLQPDDYSLNARQLKFVNGAPLENDYLITIRYVGKSVKVGE